MQPRSQEFKIVGPKKFEHVPTRSSFIIDKYNLAKIKQVISQTVILSTKFNKRMNDFHTARSG